MADAMSRLVDSTPFVSGSFFRGSSRATRDRTGPVRGSVHSQLVGRQNEFVPQGKSTPPPDMASCMPIWTTHLIKIPSGVH